MSVTQFCDWLSSTPPSVLLQTVSWIIPVVQSIHILAIAVVMTSALVFNLRIVGVLSRDKPVGVVAARFVPGIWIGVAVLTVSGTILIVGEPRRELLNSVFWLKMGLLAFMIGIVLFMSRPAAATGPRAESVPVSVRLLAWMSLACWVAIVFCGRWIAYNYEP
jgi:Ni,Fe-hydrogenase I cytochrome b subunit